MEKSCLLCIFYILFFPHLHTKTRYVNKETARNLLLTSLLKYCIFTMYIPIMDIVNRWIMSNTNSDKVTTLLDAEFHILLVLGAGEQHGYAIMKTINDHPDISYYLGPATLYRTIKRLLERSLIEEIGDRPDPENDDERRRYYKLSATGQKVMVSETERLSKLISLARDWGLELPVIA